MGDDLELYIQTGLINGLVRVLQVHPRETITEREVATALHQPVSLIIKIFDTLGVVPRSWSAPELYAVEDVLEAATRIEVSARTNPQIIDCGEVKG